MTREQQHSPTMIDSTSPSSASSSNGHSSTTKTTVTSSLHPFKIVHQRVILDIDLYEHALAGFVDIHVVPFHDHVSHIKLHCGQLRKY
jgi:hypothetical protein